MTIIVFFPRDPETQTLKVNFGRDTLAILNEVKHLSKDFPKRDVPEKAKEVFRRFNDLRNYNNSLEQVDMMTQKFRRGQRGQW